MAHPGIEAEDAPGSPGSKDSLLDPSQRIGSALQAGAGSVIAPNITFTHAARFAVGDMLGLNNTLSSTCRASASPVVRSPLAARWRAWLGQCGWRWLVFLIAGPALGATAPLVSVAGLEGVEVSVAVWVDESHQACAVEVFAGVEAAARWALPTPEAWIAQNSLFQP